MSSLEITVHLRSEQTILKSFSLEVTGRLGSDREASKRVATSVTDMWIYEPHMDLFTM